MFYASVEFYNVVNDSDRPELLFLLPFGYILAEELAKYLFPWHIYARNISDRLQAENIACTYRLDAADELGNSLRGTTPSRVHFVIEFRHWISLRF